jgi:hypothetical protein
MPLPAFIVLKPMERLSAKFWEGNRRRSPKDRGACAWGLLLFWFAQAEAVFPAAEVFMANIFINYRREDSAGYAHAIYRELDCHFATWSFPSASAGSACSEGTTPDPYSLAYTFVNSAPRKNIKDE